MYLKCTVNKTASTEDNLLSTNHNTVIRDRTQLAEWL